MNENEKEMTIEEMEKIINEHSRIIGDDEIVLTKSEYENLRLAQYNAQNTINEIFLLSLQKIEQAKKETAKEIFARVKSKIP